MARWTWAVALDERLLALVLADQGIRPEPRSTLFGHGADRTA